MILSEDRVINAVVGQLGRMGYRVTKVKSKGEQGVDITAVHTKYSRYFLVEAKGEPTKDTKSAKSGREVRFLQCLGQILTRIQPERRYYYGLAFPTSYRDLVIRRLYSALLKTLHIHLFFVDDKLNVEHLIWSDLEKMGR